MNIQHMRVVAGREVYFQQANASTRFPQQKKNASTRSRWVEEDGELFTLLIRVIIC
jgi:hypothetical protein